MQTTIAARARPQSAQPRAFVAVALALALTLVADCGNAQDAARPTGGPNQSRTERGAARAAPTAATAPVGKGEEANRRVIDGTEIRFAVSPRHGKGGTRGAPDRERKPAGENPDATYRVNVELLDAESRSAIRDASVEARVEPGGYEVKMLEPTMFNESIVYGNYFRMPGRGLYTVSISVRLRTGKPEIRTSFQYRVQ
jgi:hypothetical protein